MGNFENKVSDFVSSPLARERSNNNETTDVTKEAKDALAEAELFSQRLSNFMQMVLSSRHGGISQTPNFQKHIDYNTKLEPGLSCGSMETFSQYRSNRTLFRGNSCDCTPGNTVPNDYVVEKGTLDVVTPIRSTHEQPRAILIDSDDEVEEIDFHDFNKRRRPNCCKPEEVEEEEQIKAETDEEDDYTISDFIGRLATKRKEVNLWSKSDAIVKVEEKMVPSGGNQLPILLKTEKPVDESVDHNILNFSDGQEQWENEQHISQAESECYPEIFCFPRKKRSKTRSIKLERMKTVFGVESNVTSVNSQVSLLNLDDFSPDVKSEEDCFQDLWQEMCIASECSKCASPPSSASPLEDDQACEHSFTLKEDLGYVCQECGFLQQKIETIFDYSWAKITQSSRTYLHESRRRHKSSSKPNKPTMSLQQVESEDGVTSAICIHPRHLKQMKPHQLQGFDFLSRNLLGREPGGCILAHAPGSGKTFMLISFVQCFLAKYPHAKPLVILPKGIVGTWKKEFIRWQVDNISLLDFYSCKAEKRSQQLEVLNKWVERKSVLFLGYKQFANIVCECAVDETERACQTLLLEAPSILILDEGHTPRNEETEMLCALAKVQTERKVVLSGTLYQNHVKEVFNIIELVCPKFMKLESSRDTVRRILSKVEIPSECGTRLFKKFSPSAFCDMVELVLQNDDFKSKVTIIQELRDMTKHILHYYKGDFLEDLPGLQDLVVVLNLSSRQKNVLHSLELEQAGKFKRSSLICAVSLHPDLKIASEKASYNNDMLDNMLKKMNLVEGVKAKFFLNLVKLAETVKEKILVFSQYILPLKFLERLLVKGKGWQMNKEMFLICGGSSSEERDWAMQRFNESQEAKVLFGSIKACGEGISLVGASRVLVLDVHLNPSVTRQAIGRAFRPGQLKTVYVYRLIAADSTEEEDHDKAYKKEVISKMWFEWEDFKENTNFQLETVDPTSCDDMLLRSAILSEDIKSLYRRRRRGCCQ